MSKTLIAQSFGAASKTYEDAAPVQRACAKKLGAMIGGVSLTKPAYGLEIGCGTGFLTRQCLENSANVDWLITDLSENMLQACRQKFGTQARFQLMDGEHVPPDQCYDLIVSNLAFQWFGDLQASLGRLMNNLTPAGTLLFTTLGAGTFDEWRACLRKLGLPIGVHLYPSADELTNMMPAGAEYSVHSEVLHQAYDDGLSFLRALKAIGAQRPIRGYDGLSYKHMKKALQSFDAGERVVSYNILTVEIKKQK